MMSETIIELRSKQKSGNDREPGKELATSNEKREGNMKRFIAVLTATTLALAACGGGGADPTQPADVANAPTSQDLPTGGETPLADDDGGTTTAGMGPGISVAELLAATTEGPFLVNGYVFVGTDGSVVFSDVMAESFPPQPAGAQIPVEGIDLMQLPLVEGSVESEVPTAAWTEQPVQLLGDLVDGVFVESSVASA